MDYKEQQEMTEVTLHDDGKKRGEEVKFTCIGHTELGQFYVFNFGPWQHHIPKEAVKDIKEITK